ncbi:MAG: vitamin B12 dependent-methionine synthase activation domain-containing protein [Melioribacteraceae bacterium]
MKIINQEEIKENLFKVNFDITEIRIDKEKIAEDIGYQSGEIPEQFDDLLNQIIIETQTKCNIEAGYKVCDLKISNQSFIIENKEFFVDKIIYHQFKNADHAAVFVCTIGNEMELWSKELIAQSDLLMGYLIDVTASTIVENVADSLHDFIGKNYSAKDLHYSNRYSPGYCNWQVTEQQKLFSLFSKNFCNIKLSDASLMNPIKSISGIIGLGKNVKYREYFCDHCGIKDCTHRTYLQRKKSKNLE